MVGRYPTPPNGAPPQNAYAANPANAPRAAPMNARQPQQQTPGAPPRSVPSHAPVTPLQSKWGSFDPQERQRQEQSMQGQRQMPQGQRQPMPLQPQRPMHAPPQHMRPSGQAQPPPGVPNLPNSMLPAPPQQQHVPPPSQRQPQRQPHQQPPHPQQQQQQRPQRPPPQYALSNPQLRPAPPGVVHSQSAQSTHRPAMYQQSRPMPPPQTSTSNPMTASVAPPFPAHPHAPAPPQTIQSQPASARRPPVPGNRPAPMYQQNRVLPQRPDVSAATNSMQNMSMQPGYPPQMQSSPPPGMRAASITDARLLPRPDMSGPAVAVRVSSGDPPPKAPPPDPAASFPDPMTGQVRPVMAVEPAACPAEIFVPASPRVVRLCTAAFPMSSALARKYSMPLGAIVHPLAKAGPDDEPVPVVNFGASGIVRCRRCRSYINFSCSFRDGGHRWICSMCSFSNEVPSDYFAPLDQHGKRRDAAERPELHRGSVEFVAPAEYMVRPPMPPVYLFLLETTPAAANTGALAAAITGIRRSIDSMPNEGRTKVGIVTFDSAVQFYTLRPGEDAEPAVYVVSDINDIFLPTPDSIMVQLSECRPCFERALDMIAKTHAQTSQMVSAPCCLGAALMGAQRALEHTGGKILVLTASRPNIGPGALRERGDNSMLGTDRERAILKPDSSVYSQMAVKMSKFQISVDLFICPPPPGHYMDIASLAPLVKFTGGELFFCPSFDAPKDAPRLQLAVNRTLARETGLEAVMRIRATKSVRCTKFSGRFFARSSDLLAMPNVDADKAYSAQFTFDETSIGDGPFCLQVALLYTTTSGERRIRVHTLAIPVTNSLADLFMRVDAAATANIFVRQAAEGMKDRALGEMKKNLTEKVILALAKYREVCLSQYPAAASNNQLLLPDSMTLLPLYMHGLAKTPILSRDAAGAFLHRFDDKAALSHSVDVMSVAETSAMLYPNVIPVYPWPGGTEKLVKHLDGAPATAATLKADSGVLLDDGQTLLLWLGPAVLQRFTSELLGSNVTGPVDPRFLAVELMRRGASVRGPVAQVYRAVSNVLGSRRAATPLHVVPAGDQRMQPRVEALMVEDRTATTLNYREFLLEAQRRISQSTSKK